MAFIDTIDDQEINEEVRAMYERGVKDVVLLERETLGSGSTSKSAGGIRAQFADELNVRIALRSMAEFQALDRVTVMNEGKVLVGLRS